MTELLRLRFHHDDASPTLIHLPGLHGDWTLLGNFREALAGRARLVETSYPRRTDWALGDFATAVESALIESGVTEGWLLGESFSSQVAWTLIDRFTARDSLAAEDPQALALPRSFRPLGLILVGGFIRHPWPWGVHLVHGVSSVVPMWLLSSACAVYGQLARRQYGTCPERCAEFQEFVERRTEKLDRAAVTSRYRVIARNDLRPIARRTVLPVYHLSGAIDPLVPWWQVRGWLRRNCPGYRGSCILRRSGHNVLLNAAGSAAEQILAWTSASSGGESSMSGPDGRASVNAPLRNSLAITGLTVAGSQPISGMVG